MINDSRLKQIELLLDDARMLVADLIEDGARDEFTLNYIRAKCNDGIVAAKRLMGVVS